MRKLLIVLLCLIPLSESAQTLHTLMMCDMEDRTLARANENEVREMCSLIPMLASVLEYENNMTVHSGQEFTTTVLEQEISNLKVLEGDIVLFYYSSHGSNWSDSEWPHMSLNDKSIGEEVVYDFLKRNYPQAKLILCIANCCNMDEEGRRTQKKSYNSFDPKYVKELFLGFEGHRSYIASSSIRGQYSYAWVSGNRPGGIYGIALRDAIVAACKGEIRAEWDYVFESAKKRTLQDSEQKQMPQYMKNRW